MSPVTWLPGRILLTVHMGHFNPVDRNEIQETNQNGVTCIVRDYLSFVDSCNFTYKANSHTSEVETHTRQNLRHFGRYDAKAILSKKFRPGHPGGGVHMGKCFSRLPRSPS